MNRSERRQNTYLKEKERGRLLKALGERGGTLYEKHQCKVNSSLGYMRDGNVSHYVNTRYRKPYKRDNRISED